MATYPGAAGDVIITVDHLIFWRTFNELNAEQVKRDGEAWLRTQGRSR